MNQQAYALLGLTAIVAGLIGVLVFAVMRFAAAARDSRRHLRESGAETAFLAAALQEAVQKLKTQERAMAARAEASERLSSQIVDSLTAGLIVVGLDGLVRILNPSSRRLLRLTAATEGAHFHDLLGPGSPLAAVIGECLSTGTPIVRRSIELAGEGSEAVHLGVTVSPLLDESGQPGGVICLFTDLTAVVDLEEQLRLKDTLARLGELTAGLAHEFRNGLATIHGYARLIDLDALPASQRPCVEGIRGETDALGQVVTNFLNFARPTAITPGPVDLARIVERAADDVRAEIEGRGGSIQVEGEFRTIEGDDVLLRQAVSNLTRNALEACAGAGIAPRVRVQGSVDHGSRLQRVHVVDNGPGIEPANREKVFRPFFTTRRDGTGLGLALVQKIVITHNGRVQVLPTPGGGTTLQIVLPLPAA